MHEDFFFISKLITKRDPADYSLRNTFNTKYQKLRIPLRRFAVVYRKDKHQEVLAGTPVGPGTQFLREQYAGLPTKNARFS
jgi:hypothetical protein